VVGDKEVEDERALGEKGEGGGGGEGGWVGGGVEGVGERAGKGETVR